MRLRLDKIDKSYDHHVIKGLSYSFESGKIYVIKGVSGCGKSTLLNIIGGIESEFSGDVYIDDIIRNKKNHNNVGYVFQQSLLLSGMTILDNLLVVKNDKESIMALSRKLGIAKLLDKYPEQISGGERQRVAIVRAMLSEPNIFLADEPTASLDKTNSRLTADIINKLKSKERIIIVATHEKYFDEIADQIIYLKYGMIEKVQHNKHQVEESEELIDGSNKSPQKIKNISAISYNFKRNRRLFSLISLLPFVIMFLTILIASTIQNSFSDEYIKDSVSRYPMDAFNISADELSNFQYPDRLKIYDYYVAEENGITALYLAEKPDSIFSIDGMIQYGEFPKADNEILVSREYATAYFGKSNLEEYIGEKIIFCDREFIVVGIVYSLDEDDVNDNMNVSFEEYYESDVYYKNSEGIIIYIPYDTLNKFAQLQVKEYATVQYWRASYRNLFSDEVMLNDVRNSMYNNINIFEAQINNSQDTLEGILIILLVVFIVCFIISCIFMSSQIQIELFYRRKELGFLQIFGLKKKRICKLVFTGYLMRIMLSFLIAVLIYIISLSLYNLICKSTMIFNPIHTFVIIVVTYVFYFIAVLGAINKFLRNDIIKLVTE